MDIVDYHENMILCPMHKEFYQLFVQFY